MGHDPRSYEKEYTEKGRDLDCAQTSEPRRLRTAIEELENQFTYHSPRPDQLPRYLQIRQAGLTLALVIQNSCPSGADTSAAIRLVRQAVMTANAAIACGEERG